MLVERKLPEDGMASGAWKLPEDGIALVERKLAGGAAALAAGVTH